MRRIYGLLRAELEGQLVSGFLAVNITGLDDVHMLTLVYQITIALTENGLPFFRSAEASGELHSPSHPNDGIIRIESRKKILIVDWGALAAPRAAHVQARRQRSARLTEAI